jgi:hypothetical protein
MSTRHLNWSVSQLSALRLRTIGTWSLLCFVSTGVLMLFQLRKGGSENNFRI